MTTAKRITVIGASGQVGAKVARRLIAKGIKPTLIFRHSNGIADLQGQATLAKYSMLDVEKLAASLSESNVVLTMVTSNHAAPDFRAHQRAQIDAQISAIEQSGIRRVVNLS
jgi:putative NADH-flavin reductase